MYRKETSMTPEPFIVRLFHKQCAAPTKRPTKAVLAKADHELALSRVRRNDLESFIRSGGFHRLPALPANVVKNAALRRRDYSGPEWCYIITVNDLGRSMRSPSTAAMSIRIWLTRYYAETGVINLDQFAIVVDPE